MVLWRLGLSAIGNINLAIDSKVRAVGVTG